MSNIWNKKFAANIFTLALSAIPLSFVMAADPLEPYLAKTTYLDASSTLSTGCAYINSNTPGLAEALSIDFKLDGGALVISGFKEKDRRPLIGCDDSLEVSLDAQGKLTSALFSTSNLTISGGDSTIYNLSAGFSEARKPLAKNGGYLFDEITFSVRSCSDLTKNAVPVNPLDYLGSIGAFMEKSSTRAITPYLDNPNEPGEYTRYGPVAHWVYEEALELAASSYLQKFDDFVPEEDDSGSGGFKITYQNYQNYMNALCDVYLQKDSKVNLFQKAQMFINRGLDWVAHPANWTLFEYIETGRNVIAAPSPAGLEYYTKYTTGAGIMIVAGDNVDDEALLTARDAFIYMTSAKPEMRGILQRNHARASLFVENASELPEFGPDFAGEIGGFAQGRNDTTFTANATWQCYDGNLAAGGNPVIHELGHVLNHLVFEETNEMYWYDRVTKFAYEARENGTMPPESPLGEYWAQAVEGYIMNKGEAFKGLFPTREDIAEKHPGIYDLLTRYLPTEPWDYCADYVAPEN